jgi:hypothetical protein
MKTSLFIFMLMVVSFSSYAQPDVATTEPEKLENLHLIKGSILEVGYRYEHALNSKWTIAGNVDLANPIAISTDFGKGSQFYWGLAPSLSLETRYYYNYQKRKLKGKNVKHNSANYISGTGILFMGSLDLIRTAYIGTMTTYDCAFQTKWGFRRALGEHFIFDLSLGVALNVADSYYFKPSVFLFPAAWIGFGYKL